MPTYEAKSLIVPNCGKTELTQAVNVILGALAKGKAIKAASLEDLDALPVCASTHAFLTFIVTPDHLYSLFLVQSGQNGNWWS